MGNLRTDCEWILEHRYYGATVDKSKNKSIRLSDGSLKRDIGVVPAHWTDNVPAPILSSRRVRVNMPTSRIPRKSIRYALKSHEDIVSAAAQDRLYLERAHRVGMPPLATADTEMPTSALIQRTLFQRPGAGLGSEWSGSDLGEQFDGYD